MASKRRAGFTLLECSSAIAVLAAVMATVVVALAKLDSARNEHDARAVALQMADNALTRALADPMNAAEAKNDLHKNGSNLLPGGTARIDLRPFAASPGLVRIEAIIEWDGANGSGRRRISLVGWRRALTGELP